MTNGTKCAIMSTSRGEHKGILLEEMVETDTGELILNSLVDSSRPHAQRSGERHGTSASRLKAGGRNNPIEKMRSIV